MRRLIALVLLLTLLVAGCGSSGGTDALADVTVSKDSPPKVTFAQPFTATTTERRILTEGTGPEVAVGDKVTVQYLGINGRDGEQFDSSFERGEPADFTLAEGSLIKGFVTGLDGVKVGSRVLIGISPDDGYGPQGGQPSAGIEEDDSLLFVIDVVKTRTVLTRAEGVAVPPVAGNPSVALADDGQPTITMPAGPPPAELVISPLITGSGAKVSAGQTLTVNVVVAAWSDGRVIESSWEQGGPAPLQVGTGSLLPGLDASLVDQAVGSQLLVVVPQPDGIAAPANPSATATPAPSPAPAKPDALVFVIDILDAA